jgi:hypothetical protein
MFHVRMRLNLGMVNLVFALRAVPGHEIWHWAARFETFTERNCWAYDACAGEVWTEGGFTLALFQGWSIGSEELLEQVQLNFSFRNKLIILHPCGRLVDNTFSKMCVFKSLTGCTDYGGYVVKRDLAYTHIRVNDHILAGRSVLVHG